ncbi:MAG TPA: hypothetical protein VK586_14935 [Streptosporangiaceae bacterium]|nr:hypothetical protein [Streptosporangiaceae bacterium]
MADDELSAVLAEIKARNEWRIEYHAYTPWTVEHDVPEGDVRRLLAALEAALRAADGWKRFAAEGDAQDECADELRKVIAAALSGEGNAGG